MIILNSTPHPYVASRIAKIEEEAADRVTELMREASEHLPDGVALIVEVTTPRDPEGGLDLHALIERCKVEVARQSRRENESRIRDRRKK